VGGLKLVKCSGGIAQRQLLQWCRFATRGVAVVR